MNEMEGDGYNDDDNVWNALAVILDIDSNLLKKNFIIYFIFPPEWR